MASRLARVITALTLALTIYTASSAPTAQAASSASSATQFQTIKFYLDPALVPDPAFAQAVLPKYVADINVVLGKNTDRQLVFDPATGIILTSTKPQSDSALPPLPTEGFEIWSYAVQTSYPLSYGGYGSVDRSGAGVLAGMKWTRLYDPDNLASTEVQDYTTQISLMLHELAHVYGAGIGEYYSLSSINDTTAVDPLLNIRLADPSDSFWGDKPDFMLDPLLRFPSFTSRSAYLAAMQYSQLTAAIINADYRNGFSSFDRFAVQVLDENGLPVPGAEVKVWGVQAGSPYTSQLLTDDVADENGELTVLWGGTGGAHNTANMLRLVKVYKDGTSFAHARYVSVFDLDIAQLVQGQSTFTLTMQHPSQAPAVFTSTPSNDGWVLESGKGTNTGGSVNARSGSFPLGNDSSGRRYRSVVAFNTSDLPDDAIITGVTLMIRRKGGTAADPFDTLGNLVVDLGKPLIGSGAGLQTADFQARPGMAAVAAFASEPDAQGWYTAQLSPSAFGLINRSGSTQLRLRFTRARSAGADYVLIYSGNAALEYRPTLIITYELP